MNEDFRAALSSRNDVIPEMEFLLSYYLFIYLSQIALRFDGDLEEKKSDEYGQLLHAKTIGFIHPTTSEYVEFQSPLPDYFENILKDLRQH